MTGNVCKKWLGHRLGKNCKRQAHNNDQEPAMSVLVCDVEQNGSERELEEKEKEYFMSKQVLSEMYATKQLENLKRDFSGQCLTHYLEHSGQAME